MLLKTTVFFFRNNKRLFSSGDVSEYNLLRYNKKQTSTESNVFVCFIVSFSVFFSVGYKECRSGEYFTYRVARTKLEGTGMPISIKQDVAGRIGKSSS